MALKMVNKRDAGFVVTLVAILMAVVIFAFAGLAVDASRAYVVKGDLQKAADAGALAGAGRLYDSPPNTVLAKLSPDWNSAKQFASNLVKENYAANEKLTDSDIVSIKTGYWNLKQNPAGLQPENTVPRYACSVSGTACTPNAAVSTCSAAELCMQQDVPAVMVTVQKAAQPTYFARISGWDFFTATASSVAARGNPLTAKLSFPFAVTKCMTDYYLSHSLVGEKIKIPSDYLAVPNCSTGNWSTLNIPSNSQNSNRVIQDLLGGKATANVNIGDNITIQPGTRTNLYMDLQSYLNQTVYIPVVADNLYGVNSQTSSPVTGFMAYRITEVVPAGSSSYIAGEFVGYYNAQDASRLGGPQTNAVTPPVMIK